MNPQPHERTPLQPVLLVASGCHVLQKPTQKVVDLSVYVDWLSALQFRSFFVSPHKVLALGDLKDFPEGHKGEKNRTISLGTRASLIFTGLEDMVTAHPSLSFVASTGFGEVMGQHWQSSLL